MPFGTLSALDDLEENPQTITDFGEQTLAERVAQALTIYNAAMEGAIGDFAILTSAYQVPYGAGDDMQMVELDEAGSPDVSKTSAGGALGLPLRFYGAAVQWTRLFMQSTTVASLTARLDGAALADVKNVRKQIWRTIFHPTNNLTYADVRGTRLTFALRALLNADGMAIPPGPNGETFNAGSHTHYTGVASLTADSLKALIDNVVEHGVSGGMRLYIARAQEAAVRGFTSDFDPYVDARIRVASDTQVAIGPLDQSNPADRAIGIFDGAEVWVKPDIPANYQVALDTAVGSDKALRIRTRTGAFSGPGAFGTLYEQDDFPLRATGLGREFGVGVGTRHKVAVQYSGGSTYTEPTIV